MTNVRLFRFFVLTLGLLVAGCAGNRVNPAQLSADDLFQRASAYYEARDFGDAIPLLDVFVQQHFGDPRAPEARMMLARSHMARREYVTAAAHFQRLVEDYPTSPLGTEARLGSCEAYVRLSPRPQLDQEYTHAAIAHCQSVATNFPGTTEAEQATAHLDELRLKLAEKAYDTGRFYQRRRAFDAAVVYYNDVVQNYADTPFAPAALLQLIETYGIIGYVEEADEARQQLRTQYPDSPEAQGLQGQ